MSSQSVPGVRNREQSRQWTKLHSTNRLLQQHAFLRIRFPQVWFSIEISPRHNCSKQGIFSRDAYRCVFCEKDLRGTSELTIDHLIPKRLFASTRLANQDD